MDNSETPSDCGLPTSSSSGKSTTGLPGRRFVPKRPYRMKEGGRKPRAEKILSDLAKARMDKVYLSNRFREKVSSDPSQGDQRPWRTCCKKNMCIAQLGGTTESQTAQFYENVIASNKSLYQNGTGMSYSSSFDF
jgi:hypothetical protein